MYDIASISYLSTVLRLIPIALFGCISSRQKPAALVPRSARESPQSLTDLLMCHKRSKDQWVQQRGPCVPALSGARRNNWEALS